MWSHAKIRGQYTNNISFIPTFLSPDPCDLAKDCENNSACIGNADGTVSCRCRTEAECPKDGDGVCGSDGQTYINKCLLDVTACANKETVRVVHEGPCGKRVMG